MPTYLRGTRVHVPPDKIDQATKHFAETIVPTVRKAPGNLGAVLLVNRQTGDGVGLTYWDSAKSLGATEQVGIDSRVGATKNVPQMQVINVERSEVVLMERAAPPKAGTFLRYTSATGDINKIDAGIAFVRDKVLPVQRAQKGFRALVCSVDRQTGRSHVASTWETLADLQASEKAIAPLRQESANVAGLIPETVKVEIFEAPVVELASAVTAATAGNRS
ncbi:MAG TPA: hypothetical protein VNA65_02570 [Candidatus Dormibacteraeota bacterium]|nr:hypothetical protein [Candidatus Dormibacteraeota bacterium]